MPLDIQLGEIRIANEVAETDAVRHIKQAEAEAVAHIDDEGETQVGSVNTTGNTRVSQMNQLGNEWIDRMNDSIMQMQMQQQETEEALDKKAEDAITSIPETYADLDALVKSTGLIGVDGVLCQSFEEE